MTFHSIEELIEDVRLGRPVVMVDDEDRENEGDVIFAAEKITPEAVNFMVRHARGLVCLSLSQQKCRQLNLPLMVSDSNGTKFGTQFTISIEAAEGVTTGVSAFDRAKTILTAVGKDAMAKDIVQPGHIFPIMAQPGGVLSRAGHTEASMDLARLAGLEPAGVICEVMDDDGSMARLDSLKNFCEKYQIKMGSIADLIAYRLKHEPTVEKQQSMRVPTTIGEFDLNVFHDHISDLYHYALSIGQPNVHDEALIRVHLHDALIDLSVLTNLAEGRWGIEQSLEAIKQHGVGALVLLSQPVDPMRSLEQLGLMQYQQNHPCELKQKQNHQAHWRLIGVGSQILSNLGFGKIRVLGSEKRYYGLSGFGLRVQGFEPYQSS